MSAHKKTRTIATTWECWTYDVWGNKRDGYEVNDRSCFNRALAPPTLAQIRRVFDVHCLIEQARAVQGAS